MRRKLFTLAAVTSAVLCVAVCVLWAARVRHPRVGNGWFIRGGRYTLSLSPDQIAVLGRPSPPADPATREFVAGVTESMRETGGTLRYHGTTGGMGLNDLDFGKALGPHLTRLHRAGNAPIHILMAALEDDQFFLIARALLAETEAGRRTGHGTRRACARLPSLARAIGRAALDVPLLARRPAHARHACVELRRARGRPVTAS